MRYLSMKICRDHHWKQKYTYQCLNPASTFVVCVCSGCRSNRSQPFFIGVAGGTASGKTTVCDAIMQKLGGQVGMDTMCIDLPNAQDNLPISNSS